MKIFLSYGHDSNAQLIEKIKEYHSRAAEGNLKYEVWMDKYEIKAVPHDYEASCGTSLRHEELLSFLGEI